MALGAIQFTAVDRKGNIVPGATIRVLNEATGLLATLYSDRAGVTPLGNPFSADADGFAQFFAANGEYQIIMTGGGAYRSFRYVPLAIPATRDNLGLDTDDTVQFASLILGHSAAIATVIGAGTANTPVGQTHGTGSSGSSTGNYRWSNSANGPFNSFNKSRGSAIGTHAVVQSGDALGEFAFNGSDGTQFRPAASMRAEVDGTPGSGDMPGRWVWSTTADGASAVTDRLILDSAGRFKPATNDGVALGTSTLSFADLFLASGAVINFNNGDVTITHSSNLLTLAGGKYFYAASGNATQSDSTTYPWQLTDGGVNTLTFGFDGTQQVLQSWNGKALHINPQGNTVNFPGVGTTASAANAYLDNAASNNLLRSTSSRIYKKDIETIEHDYADSIHKLRPVWYRSLAEADRKDWSWYGLIAEEVAEIDPRLVQWGYHDDAFEIVEVSAGFNENGEEKIGTERRLKRGAKLVPDGVQYERLSVLLIDVVQRLTKRVRAIEEKI